MSKKSIKRGRAREFQNFAGSIIAIVFGIFWTILASTMTAGSGIGAIFPLFGILFIIIGIVNAFISYKNAFGKNRFSEYDITDADEEVDPFEELTSKRHEQPSETAEKSESSDIEESNFCPHCGAKVESDFKYCRKCGKKLF